MKRLLSVVLAVVTIAIVAAVAVVAAPSAVDVVNTIVETQNEIEVAEFSADRAVYKIYTAQDLYNVRNDLNGEYYLMNDVDLSAYGDWIPIAHASEAFTGFFDGQGHKVTGMTIGNEEYTNTGLFGLVRGTITNLGVDGTITTSNSNVGMLAGKLEDGKITNCYSTGAIEAYKYVGGLVGYVGEVYKYPVIENAYSRASVTGLKSGDSNYLGGLVGYAYGRSSGSATIKRCYATGQVKTKNDAATYGGILGGAADWTYLTCLFNYYDKNTVRAADTNRGFAATTEQMTTKITYTGWDFENVWGIDPEINDGYPYLKFGEYEYDNEGSGSSVDPYMIYTQEDLIAITEGRIGRDGSHYLLANDIVLDATFWTPIGGNLSGRDFAGVFDGNGHKITGINIIQNNFEYSGLFGVVTGTITNLGVDGTITTSNSNVGMLAGKLEDGKITNCYSTGAIEAYKYVGGLVGYVGEVYKYPVIENAYSRASVTGLKSGDSNYLGGLVGYAYGHSSGSATINNCYATGKVTLNSANAGKGGILGGFASASYLTITASYYDQETTGMSDTGKGIPHSTSEMNEASTFVIWDFDETWAMNSDINDGYPYLQKVIPGNAVSVTDVSLNKTYVELEVGESIELIATITPSNATNQKLTWDSSNKNIAIVSDGFVVARQLGTATITVTTQNGGKSAVCTVKVVENKEEPEEPEEPDTPVIPDEPEEPTTYKATMTLSDVSGRPGDTVKVIVSLKTDEVINTIGIRDITYDTSVLTFAGFSDYEELQSLCQLSQFDESKMAVVAALKEKQIFDGEVCTLNFTINESAGEGNVVVNAVSHIKLDGDVVATEIVPATVSVTLQTLGDMDLNDVVDVNDAILLLQYSMFPDLYPIGYKGSVDFTKDGVVDMNDAILLLQYSMFPDLYPIE